MPGSKSDTRQPDPRLREGPPRYRVEVIDVATGAVVEERKFLTLTGAKAYLWWCVKLAKWGVL